jgi:hypothetical protein
MIPENFDSLAKDISRYLEVMLQSEFEEIKKASR